jgi:hypothetical protein
MSRLVSIGLAVAVAPAILLAFANATHSTDLVTVSEAALFNLALPVGIVLVLGGLLGAARKRIDPSYEAAIRNAGARAALAARDPRPWVWLAARAAEVGSALKPVVRVALSPRLWTWAAGLGLGFAASLAIGTKPRSPGDQNFLYGLMLAETLFGGLLVATFVSLFKRQAGLVVVAKVLAIAILAAVISVLLFLSLIVVHGIR